MNHYGNLEDAANAVAPLPRDVDRLSTSEINRLIIGYEKDKRELLELIETLSLGMQGLVSSRDELAAEIKRLADIFNSLKESLLEKKGELKRYEVQDEMYNRRIHDLHRYLELAMRRETANRRLKDLSRQFDLATTDLYWNQFAMKHQFDGAKHLAATEKAILADEIGLGKTLTILMTADMLGAKKLVVISNKSVLSNFGREIKKWTDNRRKIISFVEKKQGLRNIYIETLQEAPQWVMLVNFEAWRKDKTLIRDIISTEPDMIVIDEAHALKDHTSNTFRGVRDIAHTPNKCERCGKTLKDSPDLFSQERYADGVKKWECTYCRAMYSQYYPNIRSVKYVYPMTGTIILNKPQEMWSLLNLIDPENFPDLNSFTNNYCIQKYWYDQVSGKQKSYWAWLPGGLDRLIQKIPHHILKRTKKQLVAEGAMKALPPQEIQYHNLEWELEYEEQRQAYINIKEFYQVLVNDGDIDNIKATWVQFVLMRLRQVVVWPGSIVIEEKDVEGKVLARFQCKVEKSQKLDYAENLIRQLVNEGQRVILFSKFSPPLQELHRRFRSKPIIEGDDTAVYSVIMDGSTPTYRRDEIAEDFDRSKRRDDIPPKWNVMLGNYGVGGVSLTLTDATQMIILDREWNPGKEDQAFGRLDRIGQTEETTVHILQMKRTVDIFMDGLIEVKKTVVNGLEETITAEEVRDRLINLLNEEV